MLVSFCICVVVMHFDSFSVCTSVILGGNDDLTEEESRLEFPIMSLTYYLFLKVFSDYFRIRKLSWYML